MNTVDRKLIARLAKEELERRQRLMAMKADAEQDLLAFVRMTWSILEPETPLVEGWVLETQCDLLMAIVDGHIKRAISNVVPGAMKALDSDTPILTTWGWKRHGDLIPGDFVFGPDGQPKRVLACTPEVTEPCLEVKFDDGASVIAGVGHQWKVDRDYQDTAKRERRSVTVSTAKLRTSGYKRNKSEQWPDSIDLTVPCSFPPRDFLIDPYLLGVWLGDGGTKSGALHIGHDDLQHFIAACSAKIGTVYPATSRGKAFYRLTVDDLSTKLRISGFFGHKHIPDSYIECAEEQRWELLRGLMDTDGGITEAGSCYFTTGLSHLADQFVRLCCSLGLKPHTTSRYTNLNGKLYGPHYQIRFVPKSGAIIFKLARKQVRVRGNLNPRSRKRYVESLTEVSARLVKCIQVEGDMYLAGPNLVPTHNSLLLNVFFPAWIWGPCNMPWARFISVSYATSLPERDNGRFQRLINHPLYQKCWGDRVRVLKDAVEMVENDKTGWKRVLSIGGTTTGWRANYILIDDANNPVNVESDDVRQGTNLWLSEVMPDRLNNLAEDVIINIQQRTHMADATATLAAMWSDENFCWVCVPMEFDPLRIGRAVFRREDDGSILEEWIDPRSLDEAGNQLEGLFEDEKGNLKIRMGSPMAKAEGELCWPERFPPSVIPGLRKAKGPYGWAGQYQQSPVVRGGGMIRRDWWNPWNSRSFPDFGTIIASLDTALEEKTTNDFNALTGWGAFPAEDGSPQIMLRGAWQDRLPLAQLVARVAEFCFEWKVDYLLIEHKTRGRDVHDEIIRLYANAPWQTVLVKVEGDKTSRLNAVTHLFSGDVRKDPQTGLDIWTGGMIHAPDTQWAEDVIDQFAAFPRAPHDDYCFVAGTLITTRRGNLPIEEVMLSDECLTPIGWKPVIAAGHTGMRAVVSKRGLTGTPEHPIFTLDGMYQPLDTLGDGIQLGGLTLWSLIRTVRQKPCNSGASPSASWEEDENTISPNLKPMQAARTPRVFMLLFGSIIPVNLCLLAMRSTTRTAILLIAALTIWSAYRRMCIATFLRSILRDMRRHKLSIWLKYVPKQQSGTNQKQGRHGTRSMPKTRWASDWFLRRVFARCAEQISWLPQSLAESFAAILVKRVAITASGTAILALERQSAWNVESPITPKFSSEQNTVPNSVPTELEKENGKLRNVYNLTVAEAHCYYANGILVHNCDSGTQALSWMRKNGVVLRKVEHHDQETENRKFRRPQKVPYAI